MLFTLDLAMRLHDILKAGVPFNSQHLIIIAIEEVDHDDPRDCGAAQSEY